MDLKLTGRTALITGSSKGIGLAIAQMVCQGRRQPLPGRALGRAARTGSAGDPLVVAGQRANAGGRSFRSGRAARGVCDTFPDVDILVNNAGAVPGGAIEDVDEAAWRAGWDLKVFGYVDMTRLYIARMKARRRGVIINVIGAGGEKLTYGYIAGAAGNASLMAFSRAIGGTEPGFRRARASASIRGRSRPSGSNIWRVSAPPRPATRASGATVSRTCRSGGPATTDEIAATVVFLASDLSAYTSGTVVTIDGGMTNRGALP